MFTFGAGSSCYCLHGCAKVKLDFVAAGAMWPVRTSGGSSQKITRVAVKNPVHGLVAIWSKC